MNPPYLPTCRALELELQCPSDADGAVRVQAALEQNGRGEEVAAYWTAEEVGETVEVCPQRAGRRRTRHTEDEQLTKLTYVGSLTSSLPRAALSSAIGIMHRSD
jgi:hypothetical protein